MTSDPRDPTEPQALPPTEADPMATGVGPYVPSTLAVEDDPLATRVHVPGSSGAERGDALRVGAGSFGNYELIHELGRGGMGVVYKARQKGLDRLVALKMILGSHMADPGQVNRFYVEARAAAKLNDPHVVAIHDVGEIDGQHYFAMEFVDGPSLAQVIQQKKLGFEQSAALMATVARAVGRLHKRGLVHRDLKPSNILIDGQGRPYVTDFGLVKLMEDSSGATCTGTILGTPSYMAPEQAAANASVGPRSDVYSVGAILYEMLTGRPPFREASAMETLSQVLGREPTPPRALNPAVPPALELICLKCLEKAPSDRYGSAEALAEDLDRYLDGEDVAAHPAGLWLRVRRWARREPALASRLGGLGLCLLVAQVNYEVLHPGTLGTHAAVMGLLLLWLGASWVYQLWLRKGGHIDALHGAWAATDLSALTAILIVDDAMISPLICGYPLLVAASGLWFRVALVRATTVLAVAFYALLVLVAHARQGFIRHPAHHLMCMLTIGVLGIIVEVLVKKIRVLSRAGGAEVSAS